jgi:NAD-dependent SIR2 family protein deacetylase
MNIGLSQKAKHPQDRLYELHGSMFNIKCSNTSCDYIEKDNTTEPICPALAGNSEDTPQFSYTQANEGGLASKRSSLNVDDMKQPQFERKPNALEAILESLRPTITVEMKKEIVPESELPHCPKCSSLLRPAVVWFGEPLSQNMFDEINAWVDEEKKLDLMLVIGTMAQVYPAARFVEKAKEKGARVAVVNLDGGHSGGMTMRKQDWTFAGDVEEVLDVLFEGILLNY